MKKNKCNNFLKDANESLTGECCLICSVCCDFDNIFPVAQEVFVRDCKKCIKIMDMDMVQERLCKYCTILSR